MYISFMHNGDMRKVPCDVRRIEPQLHPDTETERMLTLTQASGLARCPGCAQMIELALGCFHMTCRCKMQFCYLCRERWKSCSCPQWDQNRLLSVAHHRADAQLRYANRAPPPFWPTAPRADAIAPAPPSAPTLTWAMVTARCAGGRGMQLLEWLGFTETVDGRNTVNTAVDQNAIREHLVMSIMECLRAFHNCQHNLGPPLW